LQTKTPLLWGPGDKSKFQEENRLIATACFGCSQIKMWLLNNDSLSFTPLIRLETSLVGINFLLETGEE